MQAITLQRTVYYLTFAVACAFFCVHLLNPSVGKQGDLITFTAVIVMLVTFYITKADKDYLVGSIPLRALMFFACSLGLASLFLRP